MPEISEVDTQPSSRAIASGMATAQAILKPRKARPFFGRHPWVLESAVDRVEGAPRTVTWWSSSARRASSSPADCSIARAGFVSDCIHGIAARRSTMPSGGGGWRVPLNSAAQLGCLEPSDACRVVFSEADGLSGLIVDRYADYLAVQPTALAMARRMDLIVPILVDLLRPRGIVVRNERGVAQLEGVDLPEGLYWGEAPSGPIFITEHGIRYGVDLTDRPEDRLLPRSAR